MINVSPRKVVSSCVKRYRQTLIGIAAVFASAGSALADNPAAAEGAELKDQAIALERAGKFTEAEDAYRRSMAAYEKAFGPTNPWVGAMLNAIGRVYIRQHREAEAEPLLKRGLAIMESRMGANSVEVVAPLTRLGTAYQNTKRYPEALPLFTRAISILHLPQSQQNPELFDSFVHVGDIHRALERFAGAEDAYRKAISAADEKGGIGQLELARVLNLLVLSLRLQNRVGEAQSIAERALAIRRELLPPDSPLVGQSIEWVGAVAAARREFGKTETYYKAALAIFDSDKQRDEERVAVISANLAAVYFQQARYADAEPLWKRVVEIREKTTSRHQLPAAW